MLFSEILKFFEKKIVSKNIFFVKENIEIFNNK